VASLPIFIDGVVVYRLVKGDHCLSVVDHAEGSLPDEDTGQIFVFTEAAQGISFDGMVQHQLALTQLVMK